MVLIDNELERCRIQLREFFLSFSPETPLDDLNAILPEFSLEKFSKKQVILSDSIRSSSVYFICSGLVRVYFKKNGKEFTTWFVTENMGFASTYSLFSKNKNESVFEALEDTTVLKIDFSVLESYYKKYHSLEHIGRRVMEWYFLEFMKKSHEVSFFSAEERYSMFCEKHSDLLNRLPLKHVASYLGLSQETLSRLRAKH